MKIAVRRYLIWIVVALLGMILFTILSPSEKTLGKNVRVVYIHGAMVWTALIMFAAAGLTGASGLLLRKPQHHEWSRALGQAGLLFWLGYLPVSLWAMSANWNGLFLAEPRWKLAVVFALGGILLQLGASLLEDPGWFSVVNVVFVITLGFALFNTPNVMHPPAPMLHSGFSGMQIYFGVLIILSLVVAMQIARWIYDKNAASPILIRE